MSEDLRKYVNDPREICKYGKKCYQKNEEHHAKFKHAPQSLQKHHENRKKNRFSPYTRNKDTNSPRTTTTTVLPNAVDPECGESSGNDINQEPLIKNDVLHRQSQEKSTDKLPKNITYYDSNLNPELLKELFLVEMPPDFFKFYDCLNKNNDIIEVLSSVNLELIGPYDLLLGKLPIVDDKELYLVHGRFFYDPPEFQSVLKGKDKSEYHIGYFRDDPTEKPAFVGCNDSAKDYRIKPLAGNIFAAVYVYLQEEKKRTVFSAQPCKKLMDKLMAYSKEHNISLEEFRMGNRQAKIVTKSFHGAGIMVPYNKKTQLGYRHLAESDTTIKKMFSKLEAAINQGEKDKVLSELQPVITYASIAVDECDFGTGVEVGIAMFCSGLKELEPCALSSLTSAYSLLNREPFSKIIQAHLKYRRKGSNMSLLSLCSS